MSKRGEAIRRGSAGLLTVSSKNCRGYGDVVAVPVDPEDRNVDERAYGRRYGEESGTKIEAVMMQIEWERKKQQKELEEKARKREREREEWKRETEEWERECEREREEWKRETEEWERETEEWEREREKSQREMDERERERQSRQRELELLRDEALKKRQREFPSRERELMMKLESGKQPPPPASFCARQESGRMYERLQDVKRPLERDDSYGKRPREYKKGESESEAKECRIRERESAYEGGRDSHEYVSRNHRVESWSNNAGKVDDRHADPFEENVDATAGLQGQCDKAQQRPECKVNKLSASKEERPVVDHKAQTIENTDETCEVKVQFEKPDENEEEICPEMRGEDSKDENEGEEAVVGSTLHVRSVNSLNTLKQRPECSDTDVSGTSGMDRYPPNSRKDMPEKRKKLSGDIGSMKETMKERDATDQSDDAKSDNGSLTVHDQRDDKSAESPLVQEEGSEEKVDKGAKEKQDFVPKQGRDNGRSRERGNSSGSVKQWGGIDGDVRYDFPRGRRRGAVNATGTYRGRRKHRQPRVKCGGPWFEYQQENRKEKSGFTPEGHCAELFKLGEKYPSVDILDTLDHDGPETKWEPSDVEALCPDGQTESRPGVYLKEGGVRFRVKVAMVARHDLSVVCVRHVNMVHVVIDRGKTKGDDDGDSSVLN